MADDTRLYQPHSGCPSKKREKTPKTNNHPLQTPKRNRRDLFVE
ncbi:unnamed protein product [Nyctereutes procyonoides]|uniref:(raccoon dog) hypothetical protein n=1 Tax=Nyctereutes procyonoides TaxID=34880 RepID=A0A811ZCW1_NYCPR|nr:unnamed protein product [Nyctereutes procyonoides]